MTTSDHTSAPPLAGIRVLDLATPRAELAGRLLADLGAEVLKVEPPDGAAARKIAPFDDKTGASLYWAAVATGKRSAVLDLKVEADRERMRDLARQADIFIESADPGTMDAIGLGWSDLSAINPRLIYVSVTPYGQKGPKSRWPATDLTLEAASGRLGLQGDRDRPPLPVGYPQASFHAGARAAADAVIALNERALSGLGQHLDLSMQEAMCITLMNGAGYPPNVGGNPPGSGDDRGDPPALPPSGFLGRCECADGYVVLTATSQRQLFRSLPETVLPDLKQRGIVPDALAFLLEPENKAQAEELSQELYSGAAVAVRSFFRYKTKRELMEWAWNADVHLAPVNNTRDLTEHPQLAARHYWQKVGDYLQPGHAVRPSRTTLPLLSPAPALGADQHLADEWRAGDAVRRSTFFDEPLPPPGDAEALTSFYGRNVNQVYRYALALTGNVSAAEDLAEAIFLKLLEAGKDVPHEPSMPDGREARPHSLSPIRKTGPVGEVAPERLGEAFHGLRVLDMSWVAVGPLTGKALADHGATVVRVESSTRIDYLRTLQPYKDGLVGVNRSHYYNNHNTSKLGVALNLALPEGRALARRLADWADVIIENFTPGTMARLGLGYEELSQDRPDLIMLSTCLLGQTGPWASFAGYGPHGASIAGLYGLTGWPDRAPSGPFGPYTDVIAPHYTVSALAAAILQRRRSGLGQHIDVSQVEAAIHFLEPLVLDQTVNGRTAGAGGLDSATACPNGVYPTAGKSRYIAIACETTQQWTALRQMVPALDFFRRVRYDATGVRREWRRQIDEAISEWTSTQDGFELQQRLAEAGVPASVVQRMTDLHEDPQLAFRGFFVTLQHSEVGAMPYDGLATRFSAKQRMLHKAAPCLGEDTDYVMHELLGLSEEEIADAAAAGVFV